MFSVDLQYQVVDHCDLNCAGCDHCAPLADPWSVDIDVFEHDLAAIANVVNVTEVNLYGGEPLLHPGLMQLLGVARRVCRDAKLVVKTNGLRLKKLLSLPTFCRTVEVTRTRFKITEYPATAGTVACVNAVFPWLTEHASRVPGEVDVSEPKATMYRVRLHDPDEQRCTASEQRNKCFCLPYETPCLRVRAGLVYPCPVAMCAPLFLRRWLPGLPDVGVPVDDLTEENVKHMVIEPCKMCAWCADPEFNVPWALSTMDRHEWIEGD